MKFTVAFLFFLVIACQVYAQINSDRMDYIEKIEKYRRLKNAGTKLTVLSGVLVVVGAATIITYSDASNTSQVNSAGLKIGLGIFSAGVAGLGTGIPLWIVGGVNHRRYERKLHQLDVGFNLTPKNTGLTLTYHF